MELRDSKKTISFFARIVLQIPTIALSTATMIAISRNLGPIGRGEVSQVLLLASLTSSLICIPIFLNIMHLRIASEIRVYISRSLFIFSRRNLVFISILNVCLLILNTYQIQSLSLENTIYLNLLILFYFVSAQIRDLLLRFHKNKIYGIDFAVQMAISGLVMYLLLFHNLTVPRIIQVFVVSYGLLSLFLISILKVRVKEFKYTDLVHKRTGTSRKIKNWNENDLFSNSGIIFQFSMNKDLLLGMFLLSKADFGLMAALTSFWVVVRFLRASAVIQVKLGENEIEDSSPAPRGISSFMARRSSAIYVHLITIGIVGFFAYLMTPILLGRGFNPNIGTIIAGTVCEILLMKCLYDMSTTTSKFSQKLFVFLSAAQILILIVIRSFDLKLTIDSIWVSSCVTYLAWQFLNWVKYKK